VLISAYAKVQEGAKLARENHIDLILAVGGCCKKLSREELLEILEECK